MRLTFTLLFALLALNAFALISDRSIELSRVLSENQVLPSGKRQTQAATAYCEIPLKSKSATVECQIIVGSPGNVLNSVYFELRGDKAQELSDLLSQFHVRPQGKRGIQRANITCRLPKKRLDQPTVCQVIDLDQFIGL
jgi:hypothetical protein